MTVYPLQMDQAIQPLISLHEVWTVHSIFANSLNLQHPKLNTLLLITTENYPLMPYGVYLKTEDFIWLKQQLQVHDTFIVKKHTLIHEKTELNFGFTVTYSLKIDHQLPIVDYQVTALIHYCQSLPQLTGFDVSLADLWKENQLFIQQVKHLCEEDQDKQLEALNYLIGRGKGLTPSGDDMIIGFLAAQTALKKTQNNTVVKLLHQLLASEQKTTDVSRHYLVCSLKQQFSQPVKELVEEMTMKSSLESLEKKVQQVLFFGHTSGADTLAGFLVTLSYYQKMEENKWHKE